ncbi:unnamed protein product [Phaeothamnion confervicola]
MPPEKDRDGRKQRRKGATRRRQGGRRNGTAFAAFLLASRLFKVVALHLPIRAGFVRPRFVANGARAHQGASGGTFPRRPRQVSYPSFPCRASTACLGKRRSGSSAADGDYAPSNKSSAGAAGAGDGTVPKEKKRRGRPPKVAGSPAVPAKPPERKEKAAAQGKQPRGGVADGPSAAMADGMHPFSAATSVEGRECYAFAVPLHRADGRDAAALAGETTMAHVTGEEATSAPAELAASGAATAGDGAEIAVAWTHDAGGVAAEGVRAGAGAGAVAAPRNGTRSEASDGSQSTSRLEAMIDQFLSGEYKGFTEASPKPRYGQTPEDVVSAVLRALRDGDAPAPFHGAAVVQAFSVPVARRERLRPSNDPWRELMRGALTPRLLARRLRESRFRVLGEWDRFEVEEARPPRGGASAIDRQLRAVLTQDGGNDRTVVLAVKLRKPGGLWLIDTVKVVGDSFGVLESTA